MKLKKKILAFGLCGVIGVFSAMPAFAAGDDIVVPLSEACPKCYYGNFELIKDEHRTVKTTTEICGECGHKVTVKTIANIQTYKCSAGNCGHEETYTSSTIEKSCSCEH